MEQYFIIDKSLMDRFMEKFNLFDKKFESGIKCFKNLTLSEWLDAEDVCVVLNISPRTLQYYRDKGIIGYSKFGSKYFYKSVDIQNLVHKEEQK